MPGSVGNENNKKFKTKAERVALCDAWCKHLRSGLSKACFAPCSTKTLARVMEDHPIDFPAEKVEPAEAAYRVFWEDIGVRGMMGKIPGFSAATWIFNMKNRFGWRDKSELEHRGQMEMHVKRITLVDEAAPKAKAEK